MYTIRKATTDDCKLINELAQAAFPATYEKILSAEQIDYMMEWMYSLESLRRQMEEENHVYFIASLEGVPVGYVSVQPQGADVYHLQKIYVVPACQSKHAGRALFRQAMNYIKEVHPAPCRMELNVNRHNKALGFYEHMGMRKLREEDADIGGGFYMNDYIMGIDL